MDNEGGPWIMRGMAWDDPYRVRTWREIIATGHEVAYGKFFDKKPVRRQTSDITNCCIMDSAVTIGNRFEVRT